ncbi:MAG: molybdenum ABC transporter ATP-binding protein [Acidobacteriota bacterium]|nr:molybdenum ABC transporter ATP-binding protein [Acidobacteriota bacterium]
MKQLEVRVSLPLDRFALDVEFSTDRAVTGVFGPSGAGKSSLLEAVAGVRREARGRILFDGEAWLDSERRFTLPTEQRGVGYVPQEGLLFPHLNVRDNLLAGARRRRVDGDESKAPFEKVARLLELTPLLDREPRTLSGGERQRVALGRALCSQPSILLLDEPLASLDLPLRRRLLMLLRRVRSELTVPMVLVTHDPIEVQALCDEVVVLREGRVVGGGEPSRVLTDPEVFPFAEIESFVNVVPGRLEERQNGTARVRLGEGAELVTSSGEAVPGDEVLVTAAANQILIATEPPQGLSARNALAGQVVELRSIGAAILVWVRFDPQAPPLVVEVTEATPGRLGLKEGKPVYLVIKATSCRLYSGGAPF